MHIKIEPVKNTEAQLLSEISAKCFYDTFHEQNTEEDMNICLKQNFNVDRIASEILNPANYFFFAAIEDKIAGFIKLSTAESPDEIKETDALQISRIYAVKEKIGSGVGRSLMEFTFSFAKQHQKKVIWLGVWEQNFRAINFYKNYGFEKFGEQIFLLGKDVQTDWLMKVKMK
jgi:ribosomal protein S18 acetylase RimI-like enzyme